MKTKLTVNTKDRLFLLHYSHSNKDKDLCNLHQIVDLLNSSHGVDYIQHFWNNKFIQISRKDIKAMLEAHNLPTDTPHL